MVDDLFPMTPLLKVQDWGWDKWRVHYWRDEEHCDSKANPLLTRFCIDADGAIGDFVSENNWPYEAGFVSWEPLNQDVKSKLQFRRHPRYGGTTVIGTGWCEE